MDNRASSGTLAEPVELSAEEEFAALLASDIECTTQRGSYIAGVRVGTLIGFTSDAHIPLVTYLGQPETAALPARATLSLHASHVGREVTLLFENEDPNLPIIVGCLQPSQSMTALDLPGNSEVDADGRRLTIAASDQIVLRCGKASITLTKEGKVIIQGAYVSNQSSGVLRIKGGSVQIN